jgi:hypothetical protein
MARWEAFAQQEPEMAAAGRHLIYQYGIGLGFLATIRPDGGPRLHPFCPIQAAGGLYGLIIDSPKRRDLLRNGWFAIHANQPEDRDDEFYLTGRAKQELDPAIREEVAAAYRASGGNTNDEEWLFEFDIERALLATYRPRSEGNTWPPLYQTWKAERT